MTDPSSNDTAMNDGPEFDGDATGDGLDFEPVFLEEGEGEEVILENDEPPEDDEDMVGVDEEGEGGGEEGLAEGAQAEDLEPGESISPLATLRCHRGPVYCVSSRGQTNADGSSTLLVASGSGDDTAQFSCVNMASGAATSQLLAGHAESVAACLYSTDGSLLATTDYAGTVAVWGIGDGSTPGVQTATLDRTLPAGPTDVEWLAWHPLGNVFAVGSTDGTIWMYLAKTGGVMQVFAGHDPANDNGGGGVTCGAFSECGRHLLSGGGEGSFRIWNPKTGVARTVVKNGQDGTVFVEGEVTCLHQQLGGDKSNIAVGGSDGRIGIVNLNTKKAVAVLSHSSAGLDSEAASVEVLRWSPADVGGGLLLASGGVDGNVKVWENGMVRCTLAHSTGGVTCMEWLSGSAMERQLAVGCADGRVRLWDTRLTNGALLKKLDGHSDMVLCLSVVGRVVASGGDDHLINVWNV
jgi:ribosome assembly protein SQT1